MELKPTHSNIEAKAHMILNKWLSDDSIEKTPLVTIAIDLAAASYSVVSEVTFLREGDKYEVMNYEERMVFCYF